MPMGTSHIDEASFHLTVRNRIRCESEGSVFALPLKGNSQDIKQALRGRKAFPSDLDIRTGLTGLNVRLVGYLGLKTHRLSSDSYLDGSLQEPYPYCSDVAS